MYKSFIRFFTILASLCLITACAPVISRQIRDQVEPGLSLKKIKQNPNAYRGKVVLWGGVILGAENQKNGTMLEILQKPIDWRERPENVDRSQGRFLALCKGYLDTAIYARGREVTVAGPIDGEEVRPLGQIHYTYPLILVKQIHLWPKRSEPPVYIWPPPYYWGYPWWGFGPPGCWLPRRR